MMRVRSGFVMEGERTDRKRPITVSHKPVYLSGLEGMPGHKSQVNCFRSGIILQPPLIRPGSGTPYSILQLLRWHKFSTHPIRVHVDLLKVAMSSTTEISEQEKIKFLQDAVEALKDKGNVEKFTEAIKFIGRVAVYTDEAFDKINRTLLKFVRESGSDFPEIEGYQTRWAGYQATWQKNLKYSRELANVASGDYKRYNEIFLEIVDRIKIASDIPEAAAALNAFGEETPPPNLDGLSYKFQELQRDVAEFKKDFDEYAKNKGVELEEEAKELAEKIDGLEKAITDLDKKIKDATIALAVVTPFFWIGGIVAGSMLAKYNSERKDKQADLDKARTDLEDVNRKQKALAHIKSEFDGLTPSFTIISLSLGIFADTWASFHGQAIQFSSTLSKLQDPQKIPVVFKLSVKLARDMAEPLQHALEVYANEIAAHFPIES
ncbi:hypothetical protein HYDPIDRAFT_40949 [Hydnomerulius pinastri MD-312]|uniref:Uncharacterized protein n=1 Tax=Hydnomerulius pinastri MD-312 TaxID=994086 RepID=A0A0C9VD97_9AGAM|nr:hypothetical protein HYDPIDRAFT_40949 [Hydnomerulius pinastri MD-312]